MALAAARWAIPLTPQGPAQQGTGLIHGHPIVLVLPDTFMNVSGKAVAALCKACDIQSRDVIVVHDDMDLPVGRLRVRPGGGTGGHNGVQSVRMMLGTDEFVRLKIGIGHPASDVNPSDFVLAPLTRAEWDSLEPVMNRAVDSLECVVLDGVREAMNRYNRRIAE